MANFTPNVNLEKPLGSEHYLIPKFNANMDKIDTKFGEVAPKESPELTGVPTAPTAAAGTNTTQIATTAFVKAVIAALVDSSPTTLDTLNELAEALGNDPNFATTMATELGLKAPKASPTFTGGVRLGSTNVEVTNGGSGNSLILNGTDDVFIRPQGISVNQTWFKADGTIVTSNTISTNGIKFPATQVPSADPNTLDGYEKGTFTPIIIGGTTQGTGNVYSVQTGYYTKIGNLVTLFGRVRLSTKGTGTGTILVGGLPFAAKIITGRVKCLIAYLDNITGITIDNVNGTFLSNLSGQAVINLADSLGDFIDFSKVTANTTIDYYVNYMTD